MRSTTGHIIHPRRQGILPFQYNNDTGSLAIQCQYTPEISSSIFSPAKMCERLEYTSYTLSCDRTSHQSSITFAKPVTPDIRIVGTYINRLPDIPLSDHPVQALALCPPHWR
jgi:hypothetical protein